MSLFKHQVPGTRWSIACLLGLLFQAAVTASYAAGEFEIQQPRSVLACLTPTGSDLGEPAYPPVELKLKEGARVDVRLTFRDAGTAPKIKVLTNTGAPEFAEAVENYVKRYRLPCLEKGVEPLVTTQAFVFEPGDGRKVFYGDMDESQPTRLGRECFKLPEGGPAYPKRAANREEGGTVLARVSFAQSNAEPSIDIVYGARSDLLSEAVREHLKEARFICPMPSAHPVQATQTFVFRIEGAERHAFKDMDLMQFLRYAKREDLTNGKFDFSQMGCPFELVVDIRRPYARNNVGEFSTKDIRRKEFVEWLKGITLPLPPAVEPYLFGQSVKVSVPCMKLDL